MKVKFYGVRGSIATPGPSTVRYGGNTVCVAVTLADGTNIILDAGTGVRVLGEELNRAPKLPDPIHFLVTHSHWDHIMGAPFFGPLWRKDARIVIHALSRRAERSLARNVLFDGEHFPVLARDLPATILRPPYQGPRVRIGSATVTQVFLNHPGGADGYRIDDDGGASLCYLTDNELRPPEAPLTPLEELARFAHGASLVIHDAQYLPEDMPSKHGWGHSVIDEVLEMGRLAEAQVLALHHHDPARDDAALDRIAVRSLEWTQAHAPSMRALVATEGMTLDI